jgi:hypothetical protein
MTGSSPESKSAVPGKTHNIPVVVMRGGTSKGVFIHEEELPSWVPPRVG